MKKKIISSVVLFIVLIILGTNLAFADMGSPIIEPYKAYVSNLNGAKYYNFGENKRRVTIEEVAGTLEYNTEISVSYEYEVNNVTYAQIRVNEKEYIIKTDDFSIDAPYDKEIDSNNKFKVKIVAEEGVEIYDGPAYGYSKKGIVIPFGTELVGCWANLSEETPWIYVSYENTKGYICTLEAKVAYEEEKNIYNPTKLYTFDKCKFYKNKHSIWKEQKGEIGEIPANTVVDEFLTTDPWSENYYITYNGVSGFISKYGIAGNEVTFSRLSIPKDEITLYRIASKSSEVSYKGPLTEEEKKSLIVLYKEYNIKASGWYYIKCRDKRGWILVSYSRYNDKNAGSVTGNYNAKVINENGAKYYKYNYDTEDYENVGTLEYGREIEVTHDSFDDTDKVLYAVVWRR